MNQATRWPFGQRKTEAGEEYGGEKATDKLQKLMELDRKVKARRKSLAKKIATERVRRRSKQRQSIMELVDKYALERFPLDQLERAFSSLSLVSTEAPSTNSGGENKA